MQDIEMTRLRRQKKKKSDEEGKLVLAIFGLTGKAGRMIGGVGK